MLRGIFKETAALGPKRLYSYAMPRYAITRAYATLMRFSVLS